MPHVVELMNGYKSLFLAAQPTGGDALNHKVIVVVFTDLSADRAQAVFDEVLQQLSVPSFVEDGIVDHVRAAPRFPASPQPRTRTEDGALKSRAITRGV
jgi:hypothetical protein